MIHALCNGDMCHAQAAEIAHLKQRLGTALGELATARAALSQAQAEVAEWQDAYRGAMEGKAFYEAAFCDKCREAVRA